MCNYQRNQHEKSEDSWPLPVIVTRYRTKTGTHEAIKLRKLGYKKKKNEKKNKKRKSNAHPPIFLI